MQKTQTRPALERWTGFKGIAEIQHATFSPKVSQKQIAMCGYRIDAASMVSPVWRRNHA